MNDKPIDVCLEKVSEASEILSDELGEYLAELVNLGQHISLFADEGFESAWKAEVHRQYQILREEYVFVTEEIVSKPRTQKTLIHKSELYG